MEIIPLSFEEQIATKFTHRINVKYTDLNTTAALTKTIALYPTAAAGKASVGVGECAIYVKTAFVGASISALGLEVGDGNDPNRNMVSASILAAAGTWYALVPVTTAPYIFSAADTVDALFTAVGANLTALTAGELDLFIRAIDMSKHVTL